MIDERNRDAVSLSLQTREEIDKVCDRFEAAWKNGESPDLESLLDGWEGPSRLSLFRELLSVELTHRKWQGAEPSLAEYENRFRDSRDIVQEVFAKIKAEPSAEPKTDVPSVLAAIHQTVGQVRAARNRVGSCGAHRIVGDSRRAVGGKVSTARRNRTGRNGCDHQRP